MEITSITLNEARERKVIMMCPISRQECYMFTSWNSDEREPICTFAVHNEEIKNTDCLIMMAFKTIAGKNFVKGGDTSGK